MSSWPTQTDRFLQITTPLTENSLYLLEFSGKEELSEPFQFSLRMISSNTNISSDKLLGKTITVQLNSERSKKPRFFHGHVFKFYAGHNTEDSRYYHAEIRPWLWFLNYTSDCRIFQNKSVIDIFQLIFSEYKFTNYDISMLKNTYAKREFCVQYRETALNFISRLLEEEGIFYYFKHEEGKHTLMLADKGSSLSSCTTVPVIYKNGIIKDKCITKWQRQYAFYSGKFTQKDYNFETPDINLTEVQPANAKLATAQKYEIFHYPGKYQQSSEGKSLAQQHFEAHEMQYDTIMGEGNYSCFYSGSKFNFAGDPILNEDAGIYLISSVIHYASDNSYLQGDHGGHIYSNLFTCISSSISYKPILKTQKPIIFSAQTAIVVGPSGEELYTDKYGRVFVQFHWDRKGKKDDQSSCWIRVAQLIAGKNWGALFMPRIGQEVVVHFIDGDPDRPLIIGSVYNADNLPPYQLPFDQTQSGIKTRSTKGGGASDANEFRFEDKMGKEEIFIQAQKDFNQTIKNNLSVQVGNQSALQAQQSIELKVGSNSLLINTQGIFINGEKVNINN